MDQRGRDQAPPIDINTEATTRSIIRNGRNRGKPISNARLSSEIMKAGTRTRSERSSGFAGSASFARQHDHDACERFHHDEDGRRQRRHGKQRSSG